MPILNIRTDPTLLANKGPIIPVEIALSDESQRAYNEKGEKPPQAVTGYAMIDTGATQTCFDEGTARKARLPIVDKTTMSSASHTNHQVPVFVGKIILLQTNLAINVQKGLGANLSSFNEIVALIGRDLLRDTIFTYNGPDGSISLSI